jgi:hypothetical protein
MSENPPTEQAAAEVVITQPTAAVQAESTGQAQAENMAPPLTNDQLVALGVSPNAVKRMAACHKAISYRRAMEAKPDQTKAAVTKLVGRCGNKPEQAIVKAELAMDGYAAGYSATAEQSFDQRQTLLIQAVANKRGAIDKTHADGDPWWYKIPGCRELHASIGTMIEVAPAANIANAAIAAGEPGLTALQAHMAQLQARATPQVAKA